jgi:hypothetical protein
LRRLARTDLQRLLTPPKVNTCGPAGRYSTILFCEKEGFTEIFQAAGLPEKYDIALASTKGTSVTAARELLEEAKGMDLPTFSLTDFDYNGFEIRHTLHQDTRRYQFNNRPTVIDIGLRLTDVEQINADRDDSEPEIQSEPVTFEKNADALRENLREYGATEEEVIFLIEGKRRVELNALSTPQLLKLIEDKLTEHGIKKVVPEDDVLAEAYRNWIEYDQVKAEINKLIAKLRGEMGKIPLPDDVREQVEQYLKDHPTESWDEAIKVIARRAPR